MTRRFSTASNISLVPVTHAIPASKYSIRSRRFALAISLLALTAVVLGLATHREVLACASNCLLGCLYPLVRKTLRRTLWLRDLARSLCWIFCCYFVALVVVISLSIRHYTVTFSYCYGSNRADCTEQSELELLCEDGMKVTCLSKLEAVMQIISSLLDFIVLLSLLPFACLFSMAANEALGEEWIIEEWEPTPTAYSMVIKGAPELQDGEGVIGFPADAKPQHVETDLTLVAAS